MVCVSGGCDGYHPLVAALIGLVSGPSYLGISRLMVHLQIDDPVDAVAIHLGGGKQSLKSSNQMISKLNHKNNKTFSGAFYRDQSSNFSARKARKSRCGENVGRDNFGAGGKRMYH